MHLTHPIKIDFFDDLSDVRTKCDEIRSLLKKKILSPEEVSYIDNFVMNLTKLQLTHLTDNISQKSPDQAELRDRIETIFENLIGEIYQKKAELLKKAFPTNDKYSQVSDFIEGIVNSYQNVKAANYSESSRSRMSALIKAFPSKASLKSETPHQNKIIDQMLDIVEDNCIKINNVLDNYLKSPPSVEASMVSTHPKNFHELVNLKAFDFFPEFNRFPTSARNSLRKLITEAEKGLFENHYNYRFYQIKEANLIIVSNRTNLKGFRIIRGNLRLLFCYQLSQGTCIDTEVFFDKPIMVQSADTTLSMVNLYSRKIIYHKQFPKAIQGIRFISKNGSLAILCKDELSLFETSFNTGINLIPLRKIPLDLKNSYINSFLSRNNNLIFQKRAYMANYEETSKIYFLQIKEKEIFLSTIEVPALEENQQVSPIGDFRIIMPMNRVDFLQYSFYNDKVRPFSFYFNEKGSDGLNLSSGFSKYCKTQSFGQF